jgi:hypothetical protein
MGDCSNMYGRRPDGEPEPFGWTTMRPEFFRFSLKIFPVREPRPDGETLSFGRSHIRCK